MIDQVFQIVDKVNEFIWGEWTFYLLLGAGILFSVWTKFCHLRILGHGYQVILGKYDNADDPGAINHFQALSAALSATIGLGNIGGVALAIGTGGPGAIFWMWVVGVLGMIIKSVEITLAMLYRNTDDPDNPHGGAMWVIQKTLGARGGGWSVLARILGSFFCISLLVWAMTGGCVFQAWNVAELTNTYFGIPRLATALVMAVLVGLVIIGGIKRIGLVASQLVPTMCVIYLVSSLGVLAIHIKEIPEMLMLIVKHAFTPTAPAGAFIGGSVMLAFSQGMKRALFSNEAGSGSAPIAHAAAKTGEPAREGIVGGLGPFIDTLVICTMTALVIISTGTWNRDAMGTLDGETSFKQVDGQVQLAAPADVSALPAPPEWNSYKRGESVFFIVTVPHEEEPETRVRKKLVGRIVQDDSSESLKIEWESPPEGAQWVKKTDGTDNKGVYRNYKAASLTSHAFDSALPGLGKWMVPIAAFLFAVSTMITWAYYGEQCIYYLFAGRGLMVYKLLYLVLAVVGMSVVFIFLGLLVALICAIGLFAAKYVMDEEFEVPREEVAVISAAVSAYLTRIRYKAGGQGK